MICILYHYHCNYYHYYYYYHYHYCYYYHHRRHYYYCCCCYYYYYYYCYYYYYTWSVLSLYMICIIIIIIFIILLLLSLSVINYQSPIINHYHYHYYTWSVLFIIIIIVIIIIIISSSSSSIIIIHVLYSFIFAQCVMTSRASRKLAFYASPLIFHGQIRAHLVAVMHNREPSLVNHDKQNDLNQHLQFGIDTVQCCAMVKILVGGVQGLVIVGSDNVGWGIICMAIKILVIIILNQVVCDYVDFDVWLWFWV